MARKPVLEGGKRDEIIDAASELFFEHGYDATSIRMIQRRVGNGPGLFHYYFSSKDEVFEKALDRFLGVYIKDFERIMERGQRNPCRATADFIEYMEDEVLRFREKYEEQLHWTVRRAIRARVLEIIAPYLREAIDILDTFGVKTVMDKEVATMLLVHGIGGSILNEDIERYKRGKMQMRHSMYLLFDCDAQTGDLGVPYHAEPEDIPSMLDLLARRGKVTGKDDQLQKCFMEQIGRREVFVLRYEGLVESFMTINQEEKAIDMLVVGEKYPQWQHAERLLETALAQFHTGDRVRAYVSEALFAEDAPLREAFKKFGFVESGREYRKDIPMTLLEHVIKENEWKLLYELAPNVK